MKNLLKLTMTAFCAFIATSLDASTSLIIHNNGAVNEPIIIWQMVSGGKGRPWAPKQQMGTVEVGQRANITFTDKVNGLAALYQIIDPNGQTGANFDPKSTNFYRYNDPQFTPTPAILELNKNNDTIAATEHPNDGAIIRPIVSQENPTQVRNFKRGGIRRQPQNPILLTSIPANNDIAIHGTNGVVIHNEDDNGFVVINKNDIN